MGREPEILYEDAHVLVCRKEPGLPVQTRDVRQMDLERLLRNVAAGRGERWIPMVVHRLDQPVEGVLVFGKTKEAAAKLSRQLSGEGMRKEYLAVVEGAFPPGETCLEDYLVKEPRGNVSRIGTRGEAGAKLARLTVLPLAQVDHTQLVRVTLETGRHHQIRVQLAGCGHPIVGDRKYGASDGAGGFVPLALCAWRLRFLHPADGRRLEFSALPTSPGFLPYGEYFANPTHTL